MKKVFVSLREKQWEIIVAISHRNPTKPEILCEHTNCTAVGFSCICQGEFMLLLHLVVSFSSLLPQDLQIQKDNNDTRAKPEFFKFNECHFPEGFIKKGKKEKCTAQFI